MYKIKKIRVLSLAYTISLIYFIIGLLLAILLTVLRSNSTFLSFINQDLAGLTLSQIVLLYPIAYAAGGFVMGILVGYIYNQISKLTGGIVVQLVKDTKKSDKSK